MIEPIKDSELARRRRLGPHTIIDENLAYKVFQKKINEIAKAVSALQNDLYKNKI